MRWGVGVFCLLGLSLIREAVGNGVFHTIRNCQECVGAGYGWCPIRRACGGFANTDCTGDERDFAPNIVAELTPQNVDGFLSSSTTYKIVFVSADKDIDYDYAEDIAREMVDDRQESLHFGFVKCTEEEPNTVVLSMLALDSCLTQVVLDMDQSEEGAEAGFASEAMREVSYGFKGKSSVMEFVYSAMDSQHPLSEEAKKVAKHFVREALMGGRKSSESEPLQVYEETVSFVDKSVQSGEMSAHVGEIFLEILEECMESGMVYIADRLNRFNRDGTTTKREELSVQILNVFVEELFGGSK